MRWRPCRANIGLRTTISRAGVNRLQVPSSTRHWNSIGASSAVASKASRARRTDGRFQKSGAFASNSAVVGMWVSSTSAVVSTPNRIMFMPLGSAGSAGSAGARSRLAKMPRNVLFSMPWMLCSWRSSEYPMMSGSAMGSLRPPASWGSNGPSSTGSRLARACGLSRMTSPLCTSTLRMAWVRSPSTGMMPLPGSKAMPRGTSTSAFRLKTRTQRPSTKAWKSSHRSGICSVISGSCSRYWPSFSGSGATTFPPKVARGTSCGESVMARAWEPCVRRLRSRSSRPMVCTLSCETVSFVMPRQSVPLLNTAHIACSMKRSLMPMPTS